jgi:acylphosphatase
MPVRKKVLYAGHVQGVGFRYTAQRLAASHPVAGYVRNLPDGRVELVAEGDAAAVQHFLDSVARRLAENIETRDTSDEPPEGLTGFQIRF